MGMDLHPPAAKPVLGDSGVDTYKWSIFHPGTNNPTSIVNLIMAVTLCRDGYATLYNQPVRRLGLRVESVRHVDMLKPTSTCNAHVSLPASGNQETVLTPSSSFPILPTSGQVLYPPTNTAARLYALPHQPALCVPAERCLLHQRRDFDLRRSQYEPVPRSTNTCLVHMTQARRSAPDLATQTPTRRWTITRITPRRTGFDSRRGHSQIFRTNSHAAAGQLVFSGISRFLLPYIPTFVHTHLASPSSALNTSASGGQTDRTAAMCRCPGQTNIPKHTTTITVTWPGIEPGLSWWEASRLTAHPHKKLEHTVAGTLISLWARTNRIPLLSHNVLPRSSFRSQEVVEGALEHVARQRAGSVDVLTVARRERSSRGRDTWLASRNAVEHARACCSARIRRLARIIAPRISALRWLALRSRRPRCYKQSSSKVYVLFVHAVSLLAPHQDESGSIPGRVTPGFSQVRIMPVDSAGRRVFSGISRYLRPLHSGDAPVHLASPSSVLKTSLLRAAKISSHTHSLTVRRLARWTRVYKFRRKTCIFEHNAVHFKQAGALRIQTAEISANYSRTRQQNGAIDHQRVGNDVRRSAPESALSCSRSRDGVIMTPERTLSGRRQFVRWSTKERECRERETERERERERERSESVREREAVLSPGCAKECYFERVFHELIHGLSCQAVDQPIKCTIPTCENPGVIPPGIAACSPSWEASSLTAIPPRPQYKFGK
ncbi:hypothetical protein PR048_000368 [Dryococelus australis]|uniref:Uncharacterized protein n=1 Tax=Dryococelus australis TaxID=614101 RepID=A0ABQ9IFK6_9NEOP|nr:hypothetical protein PR048_000368 [Dryococelus australis]